MWTAINGKKQKKKFQYSFVKLPCPQFSSDEWNNLYKGCNRVHDPNLANLHAPGSSKVSSSSNQTPSFGTDTISLIDIAEFF